MIPPGVRYDCFCLCGHREIDPGYLTGENEGNPKGKYRVEWVFPKVGESGRNGEKWEKISSGKTADENWRKNGLAKKVKVQNAALQGFEQGKTTRWTNPTHHSAVGIQPTEEPYKYKVRQQVEEISIFL